MLTTASRAIPVVTTLGIALTIACGSRIEPADLVLRGGTIVTVDEAVPEAQAIAVRGDAIVAVGSDDEIDAYVGPETDVVVLDGRLVVPGFIESHAHVLWVGDARMQLRLDDLRSWDETVDLVAMAVERAQPGEWIRGRGWHQEKWDVPPERAVEGFPTHASLSSVSPDNPVVLNHASEHGVFANAKAMELMGVDRDTSDPDGGEILKDDRGDPTGMLLETAQTLIVPPAADEALTRRKMALAAEELLSKGVTSVHDVGVSFAELDVYAQLLDEQALPVRLWVMVQEPNERLAEGLARYRALGEGSGRLTVGGIKKFADGAMGSRGAWLLEPYTDQPDSSGLNTTSMDEIAETARLAFEHGYQMCVHAIGDRANREVLDLYERIIRENPDRDLRWRIEHAQQLDPADIPRFSELGVIASMQGVHARSDGPWIRDRLGNARTEAGSYVWRRLLDSGAVIANGTDAPVEDVNPIPTFHASVTRQLPDGSTFYPGQRMTREEALRSYTLDAAYAAFQEDVKGSLTVGKLADMVVLSADIMTIAEEEILTAEVLYTIVGGDVVYRP